MDTICKIYTTTGPKEVQCLIWVEVGLRLACIPIIFTVTSNFNSLVVWINLFSSPLRVILKFCRLLCILYTGGVWYLKACSDDWIVDYQLSVVNEMNQV